MVGVQRKWEYEEERRKKKLVKPSFGWGSYTREFVSSYFSGGVGVEYSSVNTILFEKCT